MARIQKSKSSLYLSKNDKNKSKKNNKDDSTTTTQCVMADSGAMCSLLNFKMVEDMGINPENLETSNVSITGVNGKKLQSVTRQMHLKIVNTKNGAESWEKVYVSPEIKTSLVSKDCLIRLKIIDPKQFLSDSEISSFSVNTVDENKEKLSECEKSFFSKEDGTIGCKCDRRVSPPEFEEAFYKSAIKKLKTMKGDLSELLALFLKKIFKSSSMNICQTQPLPMMLVPPMTVEMKDTTKITKAKKTSRIIAAPLALREQTKKTLIAL